MQTESFKNPQTVVLSWALLVAAVFLLTLFSNTLLRGHVAKLREESPWTYMKAARELMAENNMVGALRQLEEAMRRGPDSDKPYVLAGNIHYQNKKWEQAFDAYKNAIDRGNYDEGVRGRVIWTLIKLRRYEGAVAFSQKSMEEGFESPGFLRHVADAYHYAGKVGESTSFYETALKGFPNDTYLMNRLAEAYAALGKGEEAERLRARIADTQALYETGASGE